MRQIARFLATIIINNPRYEFGAICTEKGCSNKTKDCVTADSLNLLKWSAI